MNTLLQKETMMWQKLEKLIAHSLNLLFHLRIMKKQTKTKLSQLLSFIQNYFN